jgi:DNA-nicking Smr family endonuclease
VRMQHAMLAKMTPMWLRAKPDVICDTDQ